MAILLRAARAGFSVSVLLIIFILISQALTDEQKDKLKKHKSECLVETKADEELVNKLKSGDFKVIYTYLQPNYIIWTSFY